MHCSIRPQRQLSAAAPSSIISSQIHMVDHIVPTAHWRTRPRQRSSNWFNNESKLSTPSCSYSTSAHAHGSAHSTDSTMNPHYRSQLCSQQHRRTRPRQPSSDTHCQLLRDLTPRLYNHVFDATIVSSTPPAVSTYNLRPNSRENQSYSTSSFKLGNDKSLQNSVYSLQHHHSRRPKTIQTIRQSPAAEWVIITRDNQTRCAVSLPHFSVYLRFLMQSLLRISCVSPVHSLRIFCISSLSRSTSAVHANSPFTHTSAAISHQIKLTLSTIGTKSSKSDYQ